jgi:hypothetical protein
MPKLSFLCFTLVFTTLSLPAFSQAKDRPSIMQVTNIQLAKKWRLQHVEGKTNRITIPDRDAFYLILDSGGTYSTHAKGLLKVKGTWSFNDSTIAFVNKRKKQGQYKILYITGNELLVEEDNNGIRLQYTYHAMQ